jgi:NAD(P)-dependent dehydrogenase (short-subunit alcohol dehydrogenase family)
MYYPGLEGKTVLLIGGHSNLGRHVTNLFVESGAHVIIGARDTKTAQRIAAEARDLGKGTARVVEVDATDWKSLESAVRTATEEGPLDVFYQGVGWTAFGPFLDLDPSLWDVLYERNFKSVMMAYKIGLPVMVRQGHGCFITMSSVMGRRPAPFEPVYGALKCALIHLAQTLALEVAPHGVRVNVVAPGPSPPQDLSSVSSSSIFRSFLGHEAELQGALSQFAGQIPLQRVGKPENVAHAVLYLASPVTGSYQTGQVIGVDGGWYMPS